MKAIDQGWIYTGHGVPVKILSDQGSSIDGYVLVKSESWSKLREILTFEEIIPLKIE